MIRKPLFFLVLCFFAGGCHHQSDNEQSFYSSDGTLKPVVALVPVIDRSGCKLPWNISEEFTFHIRDRLLQREKIFLSSTFKEQKLQHNPFGNDLSWIKAAYPKKEFVVFMELIEHKEVPLPQEHETALQDSPAELKMSMRVRVIDVRAGEPRVILQELIHDTQYLPKHFTHYNFFQIPWGKESYGVTPLGMAHAKLAKELSGRIEDYILLAIPRTVRFDEF